MRLFVITAVLAAALALPASGSSTSTTPYWQTIKNCDHGHRSQVAKKRIHTLLYTTAATVDRKQVRHYTRCVATKAKRRYLTRYVKNGWTWRSSYPQNYAIRVNRFPTWVINYLAALRPCESGSNYATNTGNGFYGAYQFSWSTWASVGGSGNPAYAAPAEQDYRAGVLLTTSGSQHWPNCP